MNQEAMEIDAWARANIPEYRMQGVPTKLSIRGMIREARAYHIDNAYDLVHLAKLYIRTNIAICFSDWAGFLKSKTVKDNGDDINSHTYAGTIILNPYLTKPVNSILVHELTRAKELMPLDQGCYYMVLEGKDDL